MGNLCKDFLDCMIVCKEAVSKDKTCRIQDTGYRIQVKYSVMYSVMVGKAARGVVP